MRQTAGKMRQGVAAVAAAALMAGGALPAAATVLLFDQDANGHPMQPGAVGSALPRGYGDRVSAAVMPYPGGSLTYGDGGEGFTPNITVNLFAAGATPADPRVRLWHQGYGDLVNVLFGEGPGTAGAPQLFVQLLADPGYLVDLYGFDLAAFGGRDLVIASVEVFAGPQALFSVTDLLVEGDTAGARRTHLDFGGAPLSASELLIRVDVSNLAPGIQDNIGLDSLRFGQTPPPPVLSVPEPSSTALLGAALLALVWRLRARAGDAGIDPRSGS